MDGCIIIEGLNIQGDQLFSLAAAITATNGYKVMVSR